jgi:hypothetical protein
VRAQKAGFSPYGLNTAPFEVSGGTVSVPEIRLDRGGVITGRLLDAKGNPMSGMTVRDMQLVRLPDGRERPGGGSASVQTNDLGEFRLAGLPPGQHYVIAEPRLFGPLGAAAPAPATVMYVPTFYPGFADAASASPITVTSGATTNGVEFSMLAPAAYQVSGIVVDADGRAVSGALVQLMQQPRSMTMFQLQGGPSARDGTFRITNVPSGTYLAVAAIPVVIRNGNSTSSSVTFGAAASRAGVEIAVQGANLGGVRVVVGQ